MSEKSFLRLYGDELKYFYIKLELPTKTINAN